MKVLIFVVAYNAEKTLHGVLDRIRPELAERYETDILVIDDSSSDATFHVGHEYVKSGRSQYELTILRKQAVRTNEEHRFARYDNRDVPLHQRRWAGKRDDSEEHRRAMGQPSTVEGNEGSGVDRAGDHNLHWQGDTPQSSGCRGSGDSLSASCQQNQSANQEQQNRNRE